ncbi:MAG: helix-turn-helix transcriptional regulator [Treponema sp.]|nr:helix-turn-helix transcriptional regulator [Treponema sp.]
MITEEFFRDRLRFLRNERKISAREMSLALGQNETYINKIETGRWMLYDHFFFS